MADSDLTIVILRNIQAELVAINERLDASNKLHESHREHFIAINHRLDSMDARFDAMDVRFDRADQRLMKFEQRTEARLSNLEQLFVKTESRLLNLESISIGIASSLGVETQSTRHRAMRQEGEIAELKVRVEALEAIVKKPTL